MNKISFIVSAMLSVAPAAFADHPSLTPGQSFIMSMDPLLSLPSSDCAEISIVDVLQEERNGAIAIQIEDSFIGCGDDQIHSKRYYQLISSEQTEGQVRYQFGNCRGTSCFESANLQFTDGGIPTPFHPYTLVEKSDFLARSLFATYHRDDGHITEQLSQYDRPLKSCDFYRSMVLSPADQDTGLRQLRLKGRRLARLDRSCPQQGQGRPGSRLNPFPELAYTLQAAEPRAAAGSCQYQHYRSAGENPVELAVLMVGEGCQQKTRFEFRDHSNQIFSSFTHL